MSNEDIIKQLDECEDIIKKDVGNNIFAYNFSRHVFYRDLWNELTCKARGLFINKNTNEIVARSYDKFFYISPDSEVTFPVKAYIKENGFLGILSWDRENNKPFIATKSSISGKHAEIFEKRLKEAVKDREYKTEDILNFTDLCNYIKENNVSIIFEVIDIANDPHIISYKSSGIILLDVIYNDFKYKKYSDEELTKFSKKFSLPAKYLHKVLHNEKEFNEFLDSVSSPGYRNELEGFVLEDNVGRMYKIKTPFYNLWKRIRTLKEKIVNKTPLKTSDIKSPEELQILKFMQTIPMKILENMSIPIIRDRYFFEQRRMEHPRYSDNSVD